MATKTIKICDVKTIKICDVCGAEEIPCTWEMSHSYIKLVCPPDGCNGGRFDLDVCYKCRRGIHDVIKNFINDKKPK